MNAFFTKDSSGRLHLWIKKSIDPDLNKFMYFKRCAIAALKAAAIREAKDTKRVQKALLTVEYAVMQKSGYPVGTIREWKGKKFIKTAPGVWKPKYDSNTRGAKQSIKAIMRKVDTCQSSEQLLQLILANKPRFQDGEGRPLPFVQELSDYVSKRNDELEKQRKMNTTTKPKAYAENTVPSGRVAKMRQELKDKLRPQFGLHKNEKTGIEANLSGNSVNKMTSDKAIHKSEDNGFTVDDHFEVAEHIIDLYKDAELTETKPDKKGSPDIISIKRFDAPYTLKSGEKINAHITVKENTENGHKIYSVEVMTLQKMPSQKEGAWRDNNNVPPTSSPILPPFSKKSSGIDALREKYSASLSITGDEGDINLPGSDKTLDGKWKLVEADAPSASHDEQTFNKTAGFPTADNGGTVNDRDYEHDKAAKENVITVAASYDGRAVSMDEPVVVTEDGVVISGNNRTMSSKLAAKNGTDKKYIDVLTKRVKRYGFTAADVAKFKHPRVVFEVKAPDKYTTELFAQFNKSDKKAMSPVEAAVKVCKTMKIETIENIAGKIADFDTMGEMYADNKTMTSIFDTLIGSGIITKTDLPMYFTENGVTGAGKEFLETALIGSVINETNIRQLSSEGGKAIRQKLVRAILPLIENKGMNGYSINAEMNDAVHIALAVAKDKDTYHTIEDYANQSDMFKGKPDDLAMKFARKLQGTQKEFAKFMLDMNCGLRSAANGEMDIFAGGVKTRNEILAEMDSLKKSLAAALAMLGA